MGGGSGSTNVEVPTQGINAMQAHSNPIPANAVGNLSDSEFKQMNNGWTQNDMNNYGAVKEGAGAVNSAFQQYVKNSAVAQPKSGQTWKANQGYAFLQDLYKPKR